MENGGSEARKRPRPVVSCLRCRDKKLRCDRSMPCVNCAKVGISSNCAYYSHNSDEQSTRKQQRTHSPENYNAKLSLVTTRNDGGVLQVSGRFQLFIPN